jgi:hypothetical protein
MTQFQVCLVPLSLLLLGACAQKAPVPPPQTSAADGADALPSFVGKVWVSVTPGHARGSILVFLPDKTVLRDSCWEVFRVSKWGIISDTRIRWIEDTIPIEAEYSQPSPDELELRPVGTNSRENYVAISVPYVCPSMPR